MSGGQLNADLDRYRQAAAMSTAPPLIVSDPLVTGATPIEQLVRVLGLAANLGDEQDNATSAELHAQRDLTTAEAAEMFAAQDEQATDELAAGPEQIAQQLPQMLSSVAGSVVGVIGGALQPLAQIPRQAASGAIQIGTGLLRHAAGDAAVDLEDAGLETATQDGLDAGFSGDDGSEIPGGGGDLGLFGAGGPGRTAPTSYLGPPPIPSAGTAPSSAPITPVAAPGTPATGPQGVAGMAGMPMVPPGAMAATAASDKDAKADTKRVSVPPVRNGAPVQGRLTPPLATPSVVRNADGKPVITRRILAPGADQSGAAKPES